MHQTHWLTDGRLRVALALVCTAAIAPGDALVFGQVSAAPTAQAANTADTAAAIPADQLDSLVAPIALYPDPLLAQTLAASTYPLEIMQLQQWLTRNPGLKDKALADAIAKQPWDPSVQAMAALPDVVKRLADDIQWTTDLGNAFLAQQNDVMDAVQRMRQKAQAHGNLRSTPQQNVDTQIVENKPVIVIEQAQPQVVYVPSYNPVAVYGPPVYPYPPIYYPPPGAYAAGMAVSFGVGVAMGAFWSGGWGWNAGWGHNDITINNNNNFNRVANVNGHRGNVNNTWQHRPEHRGGAPYRDRATANRFGGTARGDSLANRQAGARQQLGRQNGSLRGGAVGTSGVGGRTTGDIGNRARSGNLGDRGRSNVGGGNVGSRPGGADRIGSRDLSRNMGNRSGAFGGGGFNGSSARADSRRGASSMQSRGGGFGGSRSGSGASRGGGVSRGGGGGRSRGGRR